MGISTTKENHNFTVKISGEYLEVLTAFPSNDFSFNRFGSLQKYTDLLVTSNYHCEIFFQWIKSTGNTCNISIII